MPKADADRARSFLEYARRRGDATAAELRHLIDISADAASRLRQLLLRADLTWHDQESSDDWALSPLAVLDGQSPAASAIESDTGLDRATAILTRIDHGVYS